MAKDYLGQEMNYCGQFLDILDKKLNRKNSGDTWRCECYGIMLRFKSGQQWALKSTGKKMLVEFVYPFLEELEENRKLPIFKDVDTPDGVMDDFDHTYVDLWIWDSKRKKLLSETKWSMLYLDSIKLFDKNKKEITDPFKNEWKWNVYTEDDLVRHRQSSDHLFKVLEVLSSEPERKGDYFYRCVVVEGRDIKPPTGWETRQSIVNI